MKLLTFGKRLPLSVVLALLILSAGWARADERRPACYVLSAGVDNYAKANKLNGCLNDARNTTAAFRAQQGRMFSKVHAQTLLDQQASRAAIAKRMQDFSRQGEAGDFFVIFLSGHGGRKSANKVWYFLPFDFDPQNEAATTLTDRQILDSSDTLVQQGKKVVVIIDACFSGQLRITAKDYLPRYKNPQGGGLVLMLSSSANQTSAALGQYSAFAKAFVDGMNGPGDLNGDGRVTLKEIRKYAFDRTYQLIRNQGMNAKQDSEVDWSPSIADNMPLALIQKADNVPLAVNQKAKEWIGSETLEGYGKLSFQMFPGGHAVMNDAKGSAEGTWQQQGKTMTLRFYGDRVVYTGITLGTTLSGTARNDKTSWSWNVQTKTVSAGLSQ